MLKQKWHTRNNADAVVCGTECFSDQDGDEEGINNEHNYKTNTSFRTYFSYFNELSRSLFNNKWFPSNQKQESEDDDDKINNVINKDVINEFESLSSNDDANVQVKIIKNEEPTIVTYSEIKNIEGTSGSPFVIRRLSGAFKSFTTKVVRKKDINTFLAKNNKEDSVNNNNNHNQVPLTTPSSPHILTGALSYYSTTFTNSIRSKFHSLKQTTHIYKGSTLFFNLLVFDVCCCCCCCCCF
jgi:hypothetical protein